MSTQPGVTPRLVVVTGAAGAAPGTVFSLPVGRCEIGRDPGAAISLDDAGVSRLHAVLDHQEGRVAVRDLGSRNGSWVNRERVSGWSDLRDGDVLRVGSVALRFDAGSLAAGNGDAGRPRTYEFGAVGGPVQVGEGRQYVAGRDQFSAGGDQHWDNSVRLQNDYDPWDELFSGSGFGRVLMALGAVIALTGFGLFMHSIFSASPTSTGPGPLTPIGFAMFVAGGILAGIGANMSKAARKRNERDRRRGGWSA